VRAATVSRSPAPPVNFPFRSEITGLQPIHLLSPPLSHYLLTLLYSSIRHPTDCSIEQPPNPHHLSPSTFIRTMSSINQAKQIADEFNNGCSTQELKKCFNEFKRLLVLGLKEDGHDMACIPSYGTIPPLLYPSRSRRNTNSVSL
jgi:hypothetical protein